MNELIITFDKNFFMENGEKAIGIFVNQECKEPLIYKFLVGRNGMWKVIRDFDKKNYTLWDEKREGNYLIMVQAKSKNSEKPFDYVVRSEYVIKDESHIEEPPKEENNSTTKHKNTCDDKINIFDHISEDEKKEVGLKAAEEDLKIEDDFAGEIENSENLEDEIKEFEEEAEDFKHTSNKYGKLIKYILVDPKDKYAIEEEIVFTILTENPKNTLTKYKLYIDEVLIEEIRYKESSEFSFLPRCIGTYRFEFYVRKKDSTSKFDEVVDYTLNVDYSKPIEQIELDCDKEFIRCNEDVTFTANTLGGKNVLYEFYILKDDNWELVQKYSKKNFYTMIPFKKGYYKILVLAKSFHKNIEYENYAIYKFYVNQGKEFIVNSYAFM